MRNKRPFNKNKGKINFRLKGRLTTKTEVAGKINPTDAVGMRLNKYVAHCGIANRRKATELIQRGKISVNGEVTMEAHYQIQKGDKVEFEGKQVQPEQELIYLLMNKPKNTTTGISEEKGRATVMELIGAKVAESVFPVGKMEKDSLGLLLITNDESLSKKLNDPTKKVKNIYKVILTKKLFKKDFAAISKGVELDGGNLAAGKIEWVEEDSTNKEIQLEIHLGNDRFVHQIIAHFGYEIDRLDRIYYGGLTKKDLPRGQFRFLSEREVIMLKHFS